VTGPVDALLARWRAKAARVRLDGLRHPRASYEDGAAKGASRAIEACVAELQDLMDHTKEGAA
jgi:hypothetical protein